MTVLMVAMGLALGYLLSDWLNMHIEGCRSFFEAVCAFGLVTMVILIPTLLFDNSDIKVMLMVSAGFVIVKTIYFLYKINKKSN